MTEAEYTHRGVRGFEALPSAAASLLEEAHSRGRCPKNVVPAVAAVAQGPRGAKRVLGAGKDAAVGLKRTRHRRLYIRIG